MRAALFGLAARLAATRMERGGRSTSLKSCWVRWTAFAEQGSLDDYYPVNLKFHQAILEGSGNRAAGRRLHRADQGAPSVPGEGPAAWRRAVALEFGAPADRRRSQARDAEAASKAAFDHVQKGKDRMLHIEDTGKAGGLADKTAYPRSACWRSRWSRFFRNGAWGDIQLRWEEISHGNEF